ncbi:MAG TPA: glycosyltransferase family 2 protein, partial [Candidatus Pelethocola excrementipullorum]|nr:glycosyltransferase family 2 protein [Candidatus Pelethocola excrementipullorum]
TIYARKDYKKKLWYQVSVSKLIEKRDTPQFYLEDLQIKTKDRMCSIRGWTAFRTPVKIMAVDWSGKSLNAQIKRYQRVDVAHAYPECQIDENAGFSLVLEDINVQEFILRFQAEDIKSDYKISMNPIKLTAEKTRTYFKKAVHLVQSQGIQQLPKKVIQKLTNQNRPVHYRQWLPKHMPTEKELALQRKTAHSIRPLFSIVVPLYKTPEKYLFKLIESVRNQTYTNWELCLSDGSGENSPLEEILKELENSDGRIKVIHHQTAMKISENTNAAIEVATGDYIVFADHDDELAPHALFECVKVISQNPDTEVIYSDEDKMSMNGKRFFEPQMKPDFNLDLLCTVNYICHLFVVKNTVIQKVGVLRPEFDGAQDYDFVLRCVESVSSIHHIPKILYHWRCHENSTAENPESKRYAFEAGLKAVQEHYNRIGVQAEVSHGEYLGLYRTRFIREYDPLISIIIPNKDHIDDLKRTLDAINQKSTYKNYEVIIVENNSEKKETFLYYQQLEATNPKVQVVYWKGEFNYSEINNYGASFADGEYLLLLNNDTEIINEDCLEELLGYCMRKDVGAVGARLYYEDNTIQHAGVVVGFGGIAGHCFVQQPRGATGYCHRIISAQDYSAVTAACMMVKRKAFEEVNGLSPELAVAFNDIDFCLKLGKAGYLVVYNPYAELYHYESKSRGLDDTPEKIARFNKEIQTFENKWAEILKNGDPYYSPNLTLDSQDFSLRRI